MKPCSTESKHWEYWWVETIILNDTSSSIVTRSPLNVTFVIKGSMIKLLWERTVEGWIHALDRIKALRVLVSWKYHLKRHLLIHSDERPFKCDLCNKGFNDKTSLRAHCRRVKPCSTESKHWEYWWVFKIPSVVYSLYYRCHTGQNQSTESTGEFFKIPSVDYSMHCRSHIGQNKETVKPVLSSHSKIDKTKILMTNSNLMKVKNIAKCSPDKE